MGGAERDRQERDREREERERRDKEERGKRKRREERREKETHTHTEGGGLKSELKENVQKRFPKRKKKGYMDTRLKLETLGKKQPHLRNCLHQIALWDLLKWLTDARGSSPL